MSTDGSASMVGNNRAGENALEQGVHRVDSRWMTCYGVRTYL